MSTFVRFEDPAADRTSKDYGPFAFVIIKGNELRVFDEKDHEDTIAVLEHEKWHHLGTKNLYSDLLIYQADSADKSEEQLAEEEYKELEKIKKPTAEQSQRMAELRAKHGFYIASLRTPRGIPLTEGPFKKGGINPPATTPKPPLNKVPVKPRLDPGVLRAESEAP